MAESEKVESTTDWLFWPLMPVMVGFQAGSMASYSLARWLRERGHRRLSRGLVEVTWRIGSSLPTHVFPDFGRSYIDHRLDEGDIEGALRAFQKASETIDEVMADHREPPESLPASLTFYASTFGKHGLTFPAEYRDELVSVVEHYGLDPSVLPPPGEEIPPVVILRIERDLSSRSHDEKIRKAEEIWAEEHSG